MFSSFRFRFVFRSDLFATMILFLFFDISSNFLSSSVRGSLLFNTSNTKSACCKACFDFSTPIEKNITLDNYDFTNSSSINDLTNIDTSKLESAIEVIRESNLIKSLLNLYQELS